MTAETADLTGGAHDETHIDLGFDLDIDPYDLNRAVIEDMWGEPSIEWLIEQHALDDTSAGEIAHRRALARTAPLAPVVDLPARQAQRSAA